MMQSRFQAWCAACALSILAGCSGAANTYDSVVTGTVTIDGELAKSGTVIFYPVQEAGLVATSQVFSDGSYSLRTGQGDLTNVDGGTVQSGDYLVTVTIAGPSVPGAAEAQGGPPVPGPSLVAEKYALKDTTDLKFTVKPGENVIVLALDAAEPIEVVAEEAVTEDSETANEEPAADEAAAADAEKDAATVPAAEESAAAPSAGAVPAEQPNQVEQK
jgi:hypothetical protein